MIDFATKQRGKLTAGDVVLDCTGKPMLTVTSVLQAKARYYVIVVGTPCALNGPSRLAGHKLDVINVK